MHTATVPQIKNRRTCGAGKSTTAGRLMHGCGALDDDIIDHLEHEAPETGQESCKYAWVFDKLQAERERGGTFALMTRKFETPNKNVPGHRDYVKTMITGALGSDAALLVLREHAHLAYELGIYDIVVAVNKMDICNWSEVRFKKIMKELSYFLKNLGYIPDKMPFVPVSSIQGQNILEPKGNLGLRALSWRERPLRLPIRKAYDVPGTGRVPVGCVTTWKYHPRNVPYIAPSGITATVRSFESHKESISEGLPGELVAFDPGLPKADFFRGQVASDSQNNPAKECSYFIAAIKKVTSEQPEYMHPNQMAVVHCHTAQATCKLELLELFDIRTGKCSEKNPAYLRGIAAGVVKMTPLKPMCTETYNDSRRLGRVVVRDNGRTIAVGTVKSVEKSG
ncbi:elongation factor 1-alpha 1 [Aspergillus californicus]